MGGKDLDIPVVYGEAVAVPEAEHKNPATFEDMVPAASGTAATVVGKMTTATSPTKTPNPILLEDVLVTLKDMGYTKGLAETMLRNKDNFSTRFWLLDNSGSMAERDGHRIIQVKNKKSDDVKLVSCTRWAELQQTATFHAEMASLLRASTTFRFLNDPGRVTGPRQFIAGDGDADDGDADAGVDPDLEVGKSTISESSPGGMTSLTPHLNEVRDYLSSVQDQFKSDGSKAVVVLATDGLPSDSKGNTGDDVREEFVEALRGLEEFPVWIIVRLCTDDEEVVKFWNELDDLLELNVEVLLNCVSESKEVYGHNKWLNYGLPLHRIREMGCHHRVLDFLDERKLSKDDLVDFFKILFGREAMSGTDDPEADWDGFLSRVSKLVSAERKVFNHRTGNMEPWIDMKQFKEEYGYGSGYFSRYISMW